MDARFLSKALVVGVLLSLAGCSLFRFGQRAPWRDEVERQCLSSGAVKITPYTEPVREIDGPGGCGMLQPFRIAALADGSVGLKSRAVLACPMLPALDRWLIEVVQPAARLYYGQELVGVNVGSYACRNQNNAMFGTKSEHSYGNAADIMSFALADGHIIPIEKGWRGSQADQNFLREAFVGSCRYFSTVLGPGADMFHYNHFHLDLARHQSGRVICKPIIKFEPRVTPDMIRKPINPQPMLPSQEQEDQSDEYQDASAAPTGPAGSQQATSQASRPMQGAPTALQQAGTPIWTGGGAAATALPAPLSSRPNSAMPNATPSPTSLPSNLPSSLPLPPVRPPRLGGIY